MAPARTVLIAGAGIGGLTAALALARCGFHVALFEEAKELEDIGAGIQLTPNATRVLLALGLGERLKHCVVAPADVRVRTGAGKELACIPLGEFAARRYDAPYWVIHRGDLQTALVDAVRANPDVTFSLNAEVESFTPDADGVTAHVIRGRTSIEADDGATLDRHGIALIGADGLASMARYQLSSKFLWSLRGRGQPRYSGRTAWRATVPYTAVAAQFREARVHLWLGPDAHLVHYPVKGGTAINIVAITRDRRTRANWAADEGMPAEVLEHFQPRDWSIDALALLAVPELWLRWPLFDRPPSARWGDGPVTLLGDAAHPMLPFLAQGAAMAIEDAAVLADCLQATPNEPENGLRLYEDERKSRTARVQRSARRNGTIYHLSGPLAALRNHILRRIGGERMLASYDWLYDWRPSTDPE